MLKILCRHSDRWSSRGSSGRGWCREVQQGAVSMRKLMAAQEGSRGQRQTKGRRGLWVTSSLGAPGHRFFLGSSQHMGPFAAVSCLLTGSQETNVLTSIIHAFHLCKSAYALKWICHPKSIAEVFAIICSCAQSSEKSGCPSQDPAMAVPAGTQLSPGDPPAQPPPAACPPDCGSS